MPHLDRHHQSLLPRSAKRQVDSLSSQGVVSEPDNAASLLRPQNLSHLAQPRRSSWSPEEQQRTDNPLLKTSRKDAPISTAESLGRERVGAGAPSHSISCPSYSPVSLVRPY